MAPGEQALSHRAEAVEAQLESAREPLHDDTVARSGSLLVSCNDLGPHGVLLPLIGPFVHAHPQLQIELQATNHLARLDRLDVVLRLSTHPDMPHLRRVKAFFDFLRRELILP